MFVLVGAAPAVAVLAVFALVVALEVWMIFVVSEVAVEELLMLLHQALRLLHQITSFAPALELLCPA